MRVFCVNFPFGGSCRVYDGWRRGIRGLGGAGARGYFVKEREEAGDVGDLRVAGDISAGEIAPEPLLCVLDGCDLRGFLCLKLSSLWSLIRIDRLAGVVSSESCCDFDRVWRVEPPSWCRSASSSIPSGSDSDSDESPDDEECEAKVLGNLAESRLPAAFFPFLWTLNELWSSADETPSASAVDELADPPKKTAPSLRICENGAKFPLASYRNAIRYTPGAAKVDSTQRMESRSVRDNPGATFHPEGSRLANWFSGFSNKGVSSCAALSYVAPSVSASRVSLLFPSVFSLSKVPREFLLDSINPADSRFPSELDLDGPGV